jgi:16S rRNA (cytosine1402-N4)-methyltransferase
LAAIGKKMEALHTPVLLDAVMQYLAPYNGEGLMVDATLGEGGHAYAFLNRFPGLRLIGIDADRDIQARARERLREFEDRAQWRVGWSQDFFSAYPQDAERPDRILIDLGISLYHYEQSGRGFSFRKDEYLDMRIDTCRGTSVAELLARISERELADMLYQNGEERYSRRIARGIVRARSRGAIGSSAGLAAVVELSVPPKYRHGPTHPATRTFQALRIAVNGELIQLRALLENALGVLKAGGRMGVISFHSLEDRIVKNFFREQCRGFSALSGEPIGKDGPVPVMRLVNRKPVTPSAAEARNNPPSRSAKLRVAEKVLDGGYG